MPPQVYELSRLIRCQCYKELKDFAWQRGKKGTTMFRPIVHICNDCMVSILPGKKIIDLICYIGI